MSNFRQFAECMLTTRSPGGTDKDARKVRNNTFIGGVAGSMAGFIIAGPVGLITWGIGTAITTRAMRCGDQVDLFGDM